MGGLDVDQLLTNLQDFQGAAARSAQQMALQTADARSKDGLAQVWVNAQGVVVQVEFDDTLLAEATGADAGAAVVAAAQAAAAKMRAKTQEFQTGLWQQVAEFGGRRIDETEEYRRIQPDVPLSAPDSRERRAIAETLDRAGHDSESDDRQDAPEWRLTIRDKH